MTPASEIAPGTIHDPTICGMAQNTHPGVAGNIGPTGIALLALVIDRVVKAAILGIESTQLARGLLDSSRDFVRALNSSTRSDARAGLVLPQAPIDPAVATPVPRIVGLADTAYERTNSACDLLGRLTVKFFYALQRAQQSTKKAPVADTCIRSATPPHHPWSSTISKGILEGSYHPAGTAAALEVADCVRITIVPPSWYRNFAFTHAIGSRIAAVAPSVDMYDTIYQTYYTLCTAVRTAQDPTTFTTAQKVLKKTLKATKTDALIKALLERPTHHRQQAAAADATTADPSKTLNSRQRRNLARSVARKQLDGKRKPLVNTKFSYVA
jgi:hypothetical protein